MSTDPIASTSRAGNARSGPVFTLESATRALVLVRRIVADVVRHYAALMELRSERETRSTDSGEAERAQSLRPRIEAEVATLTQLKDELAEIGCELKDYAAGLVDFPAEFDGRRVYLCWKSGEDAITHWHELESGFRGRRAIGPEFSPPAK